MSFLERINENGHGRGRGEEEVTPKMGDQRRGGVNISCEISVGATWILG